MDRIKSRLSQVESEKIDIERRFASLMQEVSFGYHVAYTAHLLTRFLRLCNDSKSVNFENLSPWLKPRSTGKTSSKGKLNFSNVKTSDLAPHSATPAAIQAPMDTTLTNLKPELLRPPLRIPRYLRRRVHYVRAIMKSRRVPCLPMTRWTSHLGKLVHQREGRHLLRDEKAGCGKSRCGVITVM